MVCAVDEASEQMVHHDHIHGHPCIEERFLCVVSGVALCLYMHIPAHTQSHIYYIYMCVHLPAFFSLDYG